MVGRRKQQVQTQSKRYLNGKENNEWFHVTDAGKELLSTAAGHKEVILEGSPATVGADGTQKVFFFSE